MTITVKDTAKIASLARIRLNEGDAEHYTKELNSLLGWIAQLQEVNTDGVAQMTSVCDMQLPMRRDEVTDGGYGDAVLKNAPGGQYQCFVVPKVVE